LKKAIELAISKPGKAAIVVRDFQRFYRNWRYGGRDAIPLWEADIPLVSILEGQATGTVKEPRANQDFIVPILLGIGGQEVGLRVQQSRKGRDASEKKGIFGGTPLNLYPKEPLNPIEELYRLRPLIAKKEISVAAVSRRLEKSTSWTRKSLERMADIEAKIQTKGLRQWLKIVNMLRDMEKEHGQGWGRGSPPKMEAVRRMTGGYIAQPDKYPAPTEDDIKEYFSNHKQYLKRREK
jgi:hypothetical protein